MAAEAGVIRFEDGAGYERMMGTWSRLAGDAFLDWLAPPAGLRWVDVGCGNGAFTELLIERCAPVEVQGIDPAEAQVEYARNRPAGRLARFHLGDAQALPFAGEHFDAAVMALVIFFVPDPAKGVAEMARVVRPGGSVSAYAWDILEGGFPLAPLQQEMRASGLPPVYPPSVQAASLPNLRLLWESAGLQEVATAQFTVKRTFENFDDLWETSLLGSSIKARLAQVSPEEVAALKERVRARSTPDAQGRITWQARANAVKGRVAE